MLLAALMGECPDALRADLQRYYGVDIDHAMAGEHSAEHVAALAACLPSDANIHKTRNPDARWSLTDVLLASLLNTLNALIYGLGDPRKRGAPPALVGPSYMTKNDKGKTRELDTTVMTIDQLTAELAKPRR